MSNLVVHFEIHASEPQRLIDFYGELLGWSFTQFGDMSYWAIDTGEGAIGLDAPPAAGSTVASPNDKAQPPSMEPR